MSKQTFTTGQVLTAAQVNSLQSNDFNQTVSVKTAAYTLVAADKGTRIEFNTSGSVTVTVNTGLFDAGDTLVIQNRGAGAVTVTPGTATVNTSATLVLSQYDAGTLYFISASAAIFFNTDAGGGSPLTTKGDLYGFSTLDARIPIGANNTVLTADSNETLGLKWAAPSSGLTYSRIASASGTATSLVYTLTAGYEDIYLAWNVTDPGSMFMRLNSLSGASYQNSYAHKIFSVNNTTSTSITLDGAVSINSSGYWNGIIKISDVNGNKPFVSWQCCTFGNGTDLDITGIANYNANITLTTVQFIWTNSKAYELVEWGAN